MATEPTAPSDGFRAALAEVERETPHAHPLRAAAAARFLAAGLPTTRLEAWRFTNVAPIGQRRFALPAPETVDPEAIDAVDLPGVDGPRAVAVDGRSVPALARANGCRGLSVRSLAETLLGDDTASTAALGTLAPFEAPADAFTALNTGLIQDGIVVSVPPHTVVEQPLHLLFASTGRDSAMSHPRVLIQVGEHSQLRLVESYAGLADGAYLTNAVTEIVVDANAVVDHCKLLRESDRAYHIASLHARVARGARFSSHSVTLGGAIVRNDVVSVLAGEGADCTLNGLYLARRRHLVDNHTTIRHAQPHCTSHELYKGILDDRARAVFNGKIVVDIDAQKTDAKQTNQALLLSENAQINTKPELEIFADDVKCTHGATIGQLDREALFYLRSRGLSAEQARTVLIHAFASDLLNRIAVAPIRTALDAILLRQLPGSGHTSFAVGGAPPAL